ncbi:hypothetical protein JB92DRAFT_2926125 [Gautieria morchelliformis]|nr:hypothetical protein JB92DRAFT_2926125 [Gautieria morchelliformis]
MSDHPAPLRQSPVSPLAVITQTAPDPVSSAISTLPVQVASTAAGTIPEPSTGSGLPSETTSTTLHISESSTGSLLPSATASTTLHISESSAGLVPPSETASTSTTIASAPQATHGPSSALIGAVLGGIMFFLVCLIIMLLRSRRNAALLSTQTETHADSRRWDALGRIFHTRPPTDTTPFRLSEAETGAGRGPTDLNQKQDMASHALLLVTQPSAMPASDGLSIHQSVMSEDQLPSYRTAVGTPSEVTPSI